MTNLDEWKRPMQSEALTAGCGLCSDDEDYGDLAGGDYDGGDCGFPHDKKGGDIKGPKGIGYKPTPGFGGPKGLYGKPFTPNPNPGFGGPKGLSGKPFQPQPWPNPKPNPGFGGPKNFGKPWKPQPGPGPKLGPGKWDGPGKWTGPGWNDPSKWKNAPRVKWSGSNRRHRFGRNWSWDTRWGERRDYGRFRVGPSWVMNPWSGEWGFGWFNAYSGFVPFTWGFLLEPWQRDDGMYVQGWPPAAACSYYHQLVSEGLQIEPPPECDSTFPIITRPPPLIRQPGMVYAPQPRLAVNTGPIGFSMGFSGGGPLDDPEEWDAEVDYLGGEYAKHNGGLYQATEIMISNPQEPGPNSSSWKISSTAGNARKTVMASDPIEAWDWAFNYYKGAQATDHGKLYRAKDNIVYGNFAPPRDRPAVWSEVLMGGSRYKFNKSGGTKKLGGAKIQKAKKAKKSTKKSKASKTTKTSATTSKELIADNSALLVKHKYNYDTWSQFPVQTLTAILFHISENYDDQDAVAFKIPRTAEERRDRTQFGSTGNMHKQIMDGLSRIFNSADIVIASDGTVILRPAGIAALKKFIRQ